MKSLDQRAMLVALNIGMWEGRFLDKDIGIDTTAEKHADSDAGRWWTHTISRKDLAAGQEVTPGFQIQAWLRRQRVKVHWRMAVGLQQLE